MALRWGLDLVEEKRDKVYIKLVAYKIESLTIFQQKGEAPQLPGGWPGPQSSKLVNPEPNIWEVGAKLGMALQGRLDKLIGNLLVANNWRAGPATPLERRVLEKILSAGPIEIKCFLFLSFNFLSNLFLKPS